MIEPVVSGPLRRVVPRHYAPTHPGTGTDQSVHAGNGEAGDSLPSNVSEIRNEVTAAYSGQINGTIWAYGNEGEKIGFIDWVEFQDEVSIAMIAVAEEYRRRGIGTAMWKKLKEEFPDEEIVVFGDVATKEGQAFLESVKEKSITERHGDHEGQEGRPGEAGGSKPGFTHAGSGFTSYPLAGDTVDGREVRENIPNTSSISASLTEWEELDGIREVPVSDFFEEGESPYYYSVEKKESTMELAAALKTSGWIEPLIIVIDRDGPYILEGGHRLDALREIGAKSFPALVVVDREQIPDAVERHDLSDDAEILEPDHVSIPAEIKKSIDEFMINLGALFGIERQA